VDLGLKNSTALVCASSKGIGKAIATSLAREGASVAICSRNPKTLEETRQALEAQTNAKVISVVADLSLKQDTDRLLKTVRTQLGSIDILINSAGCTPPSGSLMELTEDDWESAYQMFLMRVIRLTKGVVLQMMERGWGRIVNIEASAIEQPRDDLLLSSTLRAGVAAFSKAMAVKLASHNILIHTVCPGLIGTEPILEVVNKIAAAEAISPKAARERLLAGVPMARMGTPDEIASLVTCLVSDRLSYMTGHIFTVDGGRFRAFPNNPYASVSNSQNNVGAEN